MGKKVTIRLGIEELATLPIMAGKILDAAIIDAQAEITNRLQAGLVETTPVLTGQARNNWNVGVNEKPTEVVLGPTEIGVTGTPATSEEMRKAKDAGKQLRRMPAGQTVYLTNNLPYALELDVGSSTKAPQGIRAVAIERALSRSLKDVESFSGEGDE